MTSHTKPSGIPWFAVVALVILAFAGGGLLTYTLLDLRKQSPTVLPTVAVAVSTAVSTPAGATSVAAKPSLPAVIIPTVTLLPTLPPAAASATPSVTSAAPAQATAPATPPTATVASAITETPAAGPTLNIVQSANIRSGPGFNYPIIGGLEAGKTAPLLGRDASAQWYVIHFGTSAQGWVSGQVAAYSGDSNSLPVIEAPPPPPPTATSAATSVPPTSPPPTSAHGIVGTLRLCEGRTTYAAGERICIVEKIFNTSDRSVDYGILGVNAINLTGGANWFQSSWTGYGYTGGLLTLDSNCTGPVGRCNGSWEDGFKLAAGTYQFTLSICYSSVTTCQGGGEWETLTAPFTVVVQ